MTNIRKIMLFVGDALALSLSFYATLFIGYSGNVTPEMIETHRGPFFVMYFLWILVIYLFNLYDYTYIKPTVGNIRQIAISLLTMAGVGVVLFYFFTAFGISPKTNLLINVLVFGILFILWRRFFFRIFSNNFQKNAIILGENEKSKELAEEIRKNPHLGYRFQGFADDLSKEEMIKDAGVVILANGFKLDSKNIQALMGTETEIMDLVEAYEKIFSKIPVAFINETWFVENIKNTRKNIYHTLKRFFDVVISLLVLIIASPIFLIIALCIKLEDGRKIFYKQTRVGLYNREFYLYKFQSMRENAEKNGPEWSQKNDSRVTPFGRILRKSHMDELPQVINVLRGEISIVGPRPERPEFVKELEKEIPYFDLRHVIKPGVTGWAQVKFKYAGSILESYQKFEYDMFYAKNRNLFMDFGIIFRTLQKLF